MPEITIEEIAEIRNAVRVINLAAETVDYHYPARIESNLVEIREQVKRIDKLLPNFIDLQA
ncbi:unnamed protein product [marine sediment metagenome]|uniref:Uncharacterized protein n=1 Tax=marine sediment metagenome TaxID=412755 RepID=X1DAX2_9ZZZZ